MQKRGNFKRVLVQHCKSFIEGCGIFMPKLDGLSIHALIS
jgi:hypothetical protein